MKLVYGLAIAMSLNQVLPKNLYFECDPVCCGLSCVAFCKGQYERVGMLVNSDKRDLCGNGPASSFFICWPIKE